MGLILVLVFFGVFATCALLLTAGGAGASQQAERARANLYAALATGRSEADSVVDIRKKELFSAVPWINRWLLQLELAPQLRTLLYQSGLKWTVGALLLMSAACFVFPAYLLYWRTGVLIFSLLLGVLFALAPLAFVLYKRSSRFNQMEQELPEALDLMVSGLRAGHSLVTTLRLVAHESPEPISGEFKICFDEQNYGLELRTAMENLVKRVPLQDLRIVVTAILIQKESGGNLAEVLEKAAHVIRERFRLKRQIRVHTAQGRLTGWILSFLPIVLGIALYLINPKTMSTLWTHAIGIKLLYLSAFMTVSGALIIRKIVNMKV
ncbi:type II secretion system F family protein [Terriglobus albidus]|uniref:Type II secretion system F family protein n=1 Tax=Terriglobus albidus TaxID=1592106 RepID=A0A5B9E769_9BACT|nr:type II secretion system F family protein [Terriglobus albidus]QEE27898.1 type II secretion system F family protein [Terriglobus albidus]